jgi:hypothetical protein
MKVRKHETRHRNELSCLRQDFSDRMNKIYMIFSNFSISLSNSHWIPAFAGMTIVCKRLSFRRKPESIG